jgi:hypothetical protein
MTEGVERKEYHLKFEWIWIKHNLVNQNHPHSPCHTCHNLIFYPQFQAIFYIKKDKTNKKFYVLDASQPFMPFLNINFNLFENQNSKICFQCISIINAFRSFHNSGLIFLLN